MGLEIPAEVQWLSWIVGSDWPEGDETAMRRCAQAWHQAASDINELIPDLQSSASNVLSSVQGTAADSFEQFWQKFVETDPQYIPKLVELCENLAKQVEQGALDIEYAKYMFIALLIITAIEIAMLIASAFATFGASSAAIPAVEAAAQVTARTIFQRLLIAIARHAAIGALQGAGLDVLIQGIQIAKGDRESLDLKKTAMAGMDGAIGGAISGGVGHGLGHVPGLGGVADSAAGNMLRGAAREGISEAVSGVGSTLASAAIHGEPLTLEGLAKGATSGAFGGGVGGARDGLGPYSGGSDSGIPTPGDGGDPSSSSPPRIEPTPDFGGGDGGSPGGGSSDGGSSTGGSSSGGSSTGGSSTGGSSSGTSGGGSSDGGSSSSSSGGGSSTYSGGGSSGGGGTTTASSSDGGSSSSSGGGSSGGASGGGSTGGGGGGSTYSDGASYNRVAAALGGDSGGGSASPATNLAGSPTVQGGGVSAPSAGGGFGGGDFGSGGSSSVGGGGQPLGGGGGSSVGDGGSGQGGSSGGGASGGGASGGGMYGGGASGGSSGGVPGSAASGAVPPGGAVGGQHAGAPAMARGQTPSATASDGADGGEPLSSSGGTTTEEPTARPYSSGEGETGAATPPAPDNGPPVQDGGSPTQTTPYGQQPDGAPRSTENGGATTSDGTTPDGAGAPRSTDAPPADGTTPDGTSRSTDAPPADAATADGAGTPGSTDAPPADGTTPDGTSRSSDGPPADAGTTTDAPRSADNGAGTPGRTPDADGGESGTGTDGSPGGSLPESGTTDAGGAPTDGGPATGTDTADSGTSGTTDDGPGSDASSDSGSDGSGSAPAGPAMFMAPPMAPMGPMGGPGVAGGPTRTGGTNGGGGARLRFDSPDQRPVEPLVTSRTGEPEAPAGTDRPTDAATTDPSTTDQTASDQPETPDAAPPPDAVPPGLPDHLHDVYGLSEETPAGRSMYGPDEQNMRDLAQRVQADPNQYVLDGHGTPEGMRVGDRDLSASDVADIIRNDPNWNGREVMLLSCDTGREGAAFAADLARELGVPVLAPDGLAWSDNQGRVFSSSSTSEPGPDGSRSPTWPPDGGWNTFQPDGSSTPAGDRGFAPGRPDDTAAAVATPPEGAAARGDGDHDPTGPSEDRDDGTSPRGTPQPGDPASPDSGVHDPAQAAADDSRAATERPAPAVHPDSPYSRPFNPPADYPVVHATAEPNVPFSNRTDLDPNTRYKVEGRGTFWTDGNGRVERVDAVAPNRANEHNPDIRFPQPNTEYRVQTEDGTLSYRTDHNGHPPRAAVFEPPEGRPQYDIGSPEGGPDPARPNPSLPDGTRLPDPPNPGEGFAHRNDLPRNAEIRVHDTNGNYVGTYHTNGDGQVTHMSVDSGRQYRVHPELGNNHRDGVQYRLNPDFDINNPRPDSPGFRPPPTDGDVRVTLDQPSATRSQQAAGPLDESNLSRRPSAADPFADRQLEPNRRYVVEIASSDPNGRPEPYGIFYTDDSGRVVAVDTFKPFNPDLMRPPENAQIRVENGPTLINTRESVDAPAPTERNPDRTRPYVGPHGVSHDPNYDRSDNRLRRDSTAQANVGGVGRAEFPGELYAGGHAARNAEGLGGEESHQVPQLDSQNSGRNLPPDEKPHSWYDMENARAERARSGIEIGPINLVTANQPGLGTPAVMWQVWTETPPGGRPEIWIRSFPNVPAGVPSGT